MNDQKSLPQDLDLTGSPQGVLAGDLGDLYTYTAGPIDKHFVCISGGTELTAIWVEEVFEYDHENFRFAKHYLKLPYKLQGETE
jgi:hypothetical protein